MNTETSVINNFETSIDSKVIPSSPIESQVVITEIDAKKNIPALRRYYNPLKAATSLPIRNTLDNQLINENNKLSIIILI